MNVLYGNYAVKWVPLDAFKTELQKIQMTTTPLTQSNYYIANDPNSWTALAKVWEEFDQE
jgi:hypothetical protein